MPQDPGQRLQKALAHLGLGSRREIEAWIRAGRLTVNGTAAQLGMRVRESDRIRLDGRLVRQRAAPAQQVFLCHRSPGEPLDAAQGTTPSQSAPAADAAEASGRGPPREALFERLPRSGGRRFIAVSPMPQHDGGLELVTSDGQIAERLQRAVRGLPVEFSVRVRGELDDAQRSRVLSGELDSGARLEISECTGEGGEAANHWYTLIARGASGKDVRQLFERSGALVSRVLRTRLGSVMLDRALSRGRFRKLTPPELQRLLGEPAAGAERADRPERPERAGRAQRPPPLARSRRARPTGRRSSGR
jgi:23S rRNA pseudouridine2605 synthase